MWEEIKTAIFDSKEDRSPGPDGIPMRFYQQNLEWVTEDVCQMVNEFRNGGKLAAVNFAWIFLILDIEGEVKIGDFRPISLANCSYKDNCEVDRE